jgi:NADH-quinone oxidoreductase subunit J
VNVTVLFVLFSAMAVTGAGGLLICRRVVHCALSYAFCCAALAGLYLLLNQHFLAAVQLALGVSLSGIVIAIVLPTFSTETQARRSRSRPYALLAALPFLALSGWAIANASIGTPVLNTPPVWAAAGEHVPAFGRELGTQYSVPFALLGLLLLAALVGATYLFRDRHSHGNGRDG